MIVLIRPTLVIYRTQHVAWHWRGNIARDDRESEKVTVET